MRGRPFVYSNPMKVVKRPGSLNRCVAATFVAQGPLAASLGCKSRPFVASPCCFTASAKEEKLLLRAFWQYGVSKISESFVVQ